MRVADAGRPARSLRRRLYTALVLPLCIILGLSSAVAYDLAVRFAREVHDRWLSDSVNSLAQIVERGPAGAKLEMSEAVGRLFRWDAEDQTWFRLDSSLRGTIAGAPEVPLNGNANAVVGNTVLYDALVGAQPARVARLVLPAERFGEASVLIVAETVHKRARTTREIVVAMLVPQALLAVCAALLLMQAVRRTVVPLERLSARLSTQSHNSLDPLPLAETPSELQPLVTALNDLLQRWAAAMTSKQEFLATAAHDLRTPLAAALLHLEQVRGADEASGKALGTAQTALRRAARAATQVLQLAHAEATAIDPAATVTVDLCALVRQIGAELAPAAVARRQTLSLDVSREHVEVSGHYDLLAAAVGNLLDNAIKYTPVGGTIKVTVLAAERAGVRIADDGPGLTTPAAGAQAPARFTRGPDASRGGVPGTGLGLTIVREVAARHGGTLELAGGADGAGCVATLWLSLKS